jgi:TorA maturation chaperone TorD
MQAVASPVAVHRPLAAEEAARADFYALLGRLLQLPPDNALLRTLAAASAIPAEGDARLAGAWQDLIDASSAMDAEAALDEYEALFGGVGKSSVSPYAGFYSGATAVEHPRVRIRDDLAGLGLAPRDASTEPEDHFAALFDAMRILVGGGAGRGPATLAEQRRFFEFHVKPGVGKFVQALSRAPQANYYRKVAALGAAFFAIETESFQLEA